MNLRPKPWPAFAAIPCTSDPNPINHRCHEALKDVEWDTLLFFAALFVLVEALGEMGLLRAIATSLSHVITQVRI